jgi:hypothetical protein
MMNGYNATMRGPRTQSRPVFTRNPNVKLPDTVGMYKHKEKYLSEEYFFLLFSRLA